MAQSDSGTVSTDTLTLVTEPAIPVVSAAFTALGAYVSPTATVTGYGFADASTMNAFFTDYQALRAQLVALTATLTNDRQIIAA